MDWDELKTVMAIARAGSLSGAARTLGVTHSTVFRRLGAIEKELGVRLFERLPTGYTMTAAGETMLESANRVDDEIAALERALTGQDTRLEGSLRIATTDTLALKFLGPMLADFGARYPGITLELALDNAFFNLSKREADVAIRPSANPPEILVGRHVGDIASAIYASKSYRKKNRSRDLGKHRWLLPDASLGHLASVQWVAREFPGAETALLSNSLLGLHAAARSGLGIAPLPCFVGDSDDALVRMSGPVAELATPLWLLTHPDLRRTGRVHAFMEFMFEAIAADRRLLAGRAKRG
ncbi:MAG: LysR family transcriptional regulator [Gammaproteobacteria bacterium]|nr:LysR family transcriptional regulator [Gammaproteobacteria bacterium]